MRVIAQVRGVRNHEVEFAVHATQYVAVHRFGPHGSELGVHFCQAQCVAIDVGEHHRQSCHLPLGERNAPDARAAADVHDALSRQRFRFDGAREAIAIRAENTAS